MTKRSSSNPPRGRNSEGGEGGPNMVVVAGIVGVAALVLIALAIFSNRGGDGGGLTINDRNATAEAAATQAEATQAAAAELARAGLPAYCDTNPDRCVVSGADDAPLTIYEVSDYGCSACRAFNQTTLPQLKQQYIDAGLVRLVKLPSAILGNATLSAANAVLCANAQGAGAAMHEQIFDYQIPGNAPRAADVRTLAETLGLDMDSFNSCVQDNSYLSAAQANTQLAIDLGTTATPTFYIAGERVVGADLGPLTAAIQRNLSGSQ